MRLLELKQVSAGYGQTAVLRDVSLNVLAGEAVAIIGANGAGKTTLLRCISGLLQATQGSIRFAERDITRLRADLIVNQGLVHCPEGRAILRRMSVLENLELGAYRLKEPAAADLERVYALFPRLRERQQQAGGSLSGGEQQMLAIGRAMMARPRMLMLDEPSLGLSPLMVHEVFKGLRQLKDSGLSILLIEQNAHAALKFSDRTYVLEHGRVTLEGESASLAADPRVREAYLGTA
ncbi:MAG TPA: ABC transporter ATP-binding protein [Burkholderiales bacterium]